MCLQDCLLDLQVDCQSLGLCTPGIAYLVCEDMHFSYISIGQFGFNSLCAVEEFFVLETGSLKVFYNFNQTFLVSRKLYGHCINSWHLFEPSVVSATIFLFLTSIFVVAFGRLPSLHSEMRTNPFCGMRWLRLISCLIKSIARVPSFP